MKLTRRHDLKVALWDAQEGRCFYCEVDMFFDRFWRKQLAKYSGITAKEYSARVATFEHLKRKAEGGTWYIANIALACKRCNCSRGERPVEEHRAAMQSRRARFRPK